MSWLEDMYENAADAAQGARESIAGALSDVTADDVLRYSSPAGYLATEARPQLEGAGVTLRETADDAAEGAQSLATGARETLSDARETVRRVAGAAGEAAETAADTIRWGWFALVGVSVVAVLALIGLAFYFLKQGGAQALASVLAP
jgi:CHASE3 domain sensor protein